MTIDTQSPDFKRIRRNALRRKPEGEREFIVATQIAFLLDNMVSHLAFSSRGRFGPALEAAFDTLGEYQTTQPDQCPPQAVKVARALLSSSAWDRHEDFNAWQQARLAEQAELT